MLLLGFFQKSRPVFLLELLLLQLELDVLGGVVDLALLRVDLPEKFQLKVVVALETAGDTAECQGGGLQVELKVRLGNVGDGDSQPDEIFLGVRGGGALSPENCGELDVSLPCAVFVFFECLSVCIPKSFGNSLILRVEECSLRYRIGWSRISPSGVNFSDMFTLVGKDGDGGKKEGYQVKKFDRRYQSRSGSMGIQN